MTNKNRSTATKYKVTKIKLIKMTKIRKTLSLGWEDPVVFGFVEKEMEVTGHLILNKKIMYLIWTRRYNFAMWSFYHQPDFNIICMNSYLTNKCVHLTCVHLSNKSRKEVSGYVGLYSVHEILRWCWCVCVHTSCMHVCTYLSDKHCNNHTWNIQI